MRHKLARKKLGRTSSHRKALLKNLSIALIQHQKIETTLIKAKELRVYFDKLITAAKKNDFNAHRNIFARLQDKASTNKVITEIAPKLADRQGGYTSIKRVGQRRGDAAMIAQISIINI